MKIELKRIYTCPTRLIGIKGFEGVLLHCGNKASSSEPLDLEDWQNED